MFITFEGGEGVGKTTLIKKIENYFLQKGESCLITREPGGTPRSEEIRTLLLTNPSYSNEEKIELFVSARIDHNQKVIIPALQKNEIVLCDRYFDSTFVYQGLLLDEHNFKMCVEKNLKPNIYIPNLTFILDLDPIVAQNRLKNNNRETNYIDNKPIAYHQKLRKAYIDVIAYKNKYFLNEFKKQEMIIIDVNKSEEEVFTQVIIEIEKRVEECVEQ